MDPNVENKSNSSNEESNLNIKLVLKTKGVEISTEGSIREISSAVSELSDLIDLIKNQIDLELPIDEDIIDEDIVSMPSTTTTTTPSLSTSTTLPPLPASDIPAIEVQRGIKDTIDVLFSTPWGRTPHSVSEVMRALEVNTFYTGTSQAQTALNRLVREGKVRRIQREGKWTYFSIPF